MPLAWATLLVIYIFECQKKPPHLPRGPRNSHINLKKIRIWTVGFYKDLTVCNSLKNPCPLRLTSRLQQRVHVRYNKQEYRNSYVSIIVVTNRRILLRPQAHSTMFWPDRVWLIDQECRAALVVRLQLTSRILRMQIEQHGHQAASLRMQTIEPK